MRGKYILYAFFIFSCSNPAKSKKEMFTNVEPKCFAYPPSIDSMNLDALYDSARWFIYTWHCDQAYLSKKDTLKSITFGELPLRFDNIKLENDSLELNFYFIDNGQIILSSMTRDFSKLNAGVGFNMKSKQKICMISPNGFSIVQTRGNNRFEQPLQSEVLDYITNHWNRLNECFRELAIAHGITKE